MKTFDSLQFTNVWGGMRLDSRRLGPRDLARATWPQATWRSKSVVFRVFGVFGVFGVFFQVSISIQVI